MTDREILIELMDEYEYPSSVGGMADHLIANGVAVQRWIPVTERLPGIGELVLVCAGDHIDVNYLEGCAVWGFDYDEKITHWMPLPKMPKGE